MKTSPKLLSLVVLTVDIGKKQDLRYISQRQKRKINYCRFNVWYVNMYVYFLAVYFEVVCVIVVVGE